MKRDISMTTNFCVTHEQGVIRVVCPDYVLPEKKFVDKLFELIDEFLGAW